MQVIPAVDVLEGRVVRLRQGDFARVTEYADDPVEQVDRWTHQGAGLVHVVDLGGARLGAPDRNLWRVLADSGRRFQIGGGLRTVELGAEALQVGAERVVLGTAAVWEPSVVNHLVESFGPDRVVAAVDTRQGLATGSGWEDAGRPVVEVCRSLRDAGIRWILATGIDRDGMLSGPDTDLLQQIRRVDKRLKLIASGGVGSLSDIARLQADAYEAVVVGRALYEGRFTLAEAIAAAQP